MCTLLGYVVSFSHLIITIALIQMWSQFIRSFIHVSFIDSYRNPINKYSMIREGKREKNYNKEDEILKIKHHLSNGFFLT